MIRYFFEVSYNGTAFHGWQKQPNAVTVQELIEQALFTFFRTNIEIVGSGRTDTGVHCRQQFFHADFQNEIKSIEQALFRLNRILPAEIALLNIYEVEPESHARFDALDRYYEYIITTQKNPHLIQLAHLFQKPLDWENMNSAAALLKGEHDFESFSKVKTDVNTFICTIFEAEWKDRGAEKVFCIRGNRFLRGMVRAIVGTLLEVGKGNISVEDFAQIIANKDRKKAGMAAPPEGLYLTQVNYPKGFFKQKNIE